MKHIFLMIMLFAVPAWGTLTRSIDTRTTYLNPYRWTGDQKDFLLDWAQEMEDIVDGTVGFTGGIYIIPQSAEGTAREGQIYYDSDVDEFLGYANGSFVNFGASAVGNSLDGAYDAGNTIDVDGTAVTMTVSDTDNNVALAIVQNDATNDPDALTITMGALSTGTGLTINSQVGGTDIAGDNWSVTQAGIGAFSGALSTTGITTSSGVSLFGDGTNTVQVNSSTWDVSTTGAFSGVSTLGMSGDLTLSAGDLILANGKGVLSSTTTSQTAGLFGYDNDNSTYRNTFLVTNGNTIAATIGTGLETLAVDTTTWDVSTAGVFTGMAGITNAGVLVTTGAAVDLNVSSNFAVNVGTGTTTATVTIGGSAAQTINIGDGAAAKTVTLGSSNTTSTTTLLSGSGALNLNLSNNQPTNIGTGTTTATVTLGGAANQTIAIGIGAAAKLVSIGSNSGASSLDLLSGSGNFTINSAAGAATTGIGIGATTGAITIGGSSAQTVTIGAGAAAMTVVLGSTNSTSTTTINAGSGGIVVAGDIAGTGPASTVVGLASLLTVYTGANNALTIAQTGSVWTNTSDGDSSLHTLPEASTALGCSYTFVVTTAQLLNINPNDGTDRIWGLTDGAGDAIASAAVGDSITLMAVQDDIWVVTGCNNSNGNADAWADVN